MRTGHPPHDSRAARRSPTRATNSACGLGRLGHAGRRTAPLLRAFMLFTCRRKATVPWMPEQEGATSAREVRSWTGDDHRTFEYAANSSRWRGRVGPAPGRRSRDAYRALSPSLAGPRAGCQEKIAWPRRASNGSPGTRRAGTVEREDRPDALATSAPQLRTRSPETVPAAQPDQTGQSALRGDLVRNEKTTAARYFVPHGEALPGFRGMDWTAPRRNKGVVTLQNVTYWWPEHGQVPSFPGLRVAGGAPKVPPRRPLVEGGAFSVPSHAGRGEVKHRAHELGPATPIIGRE